jgi:hypothetical protein
MQKMHTWEGLDLSLGKCEKGKEVFSDVAIIRLKNKTKKSLRVQRHRIGHSGQKKGPIESPWFERP